MTPPTQTTYPNNDSLSFRLHEAARRNRSRVLGDLLARLTDGLTLPLPAQLQIARWG